MHSTKLTKYLCFLYLIALTWIILFKMALSYNQIPMFQSINVIPFGQSVNVNGHLDVSEIILNVIAFVPLGMYLKTLFHKKIGYLVCMVFVTSFTFETLQYLLHLGASDITDLITNTTGGMIGIRLAYGLEKITKNHVMVMNVISVIFASLLFGFIGLMIVANM